MAVKDCLLGMQLLIIQVFLLSRSACTKTGPWLQQAVRFCNVIAQVQATYPPKPVVVTAKAAAETSAGGMVDWKTTWSSVLGRDDD